MQKQENVEKNMNFVKILVKITLENVIMLSKFQATRLKKLLKEEKYVFEKQYRYHRLVSLDQSQKMANAEKNYSSKIGKILMYIIDT